MRLDEIEMRSLGCDLLDDHKNKIQPPPQVAAETAPTTTGLGPIRMMSMLNACFFP